MQVGCEQKSYEKCCKQKKVVCDIRGSKVCTIKFNVRLLHPGKSRILQIWSIHAEISNCQNIFARYQSASG